MRAQQKALAAKDFLLAAQKSAAAAAADKSAAAIHELTLQVSAAVSARNEAQFTTARVEDVCEVQSRDIAVAHGKVQQLEQAVQSLESGCASKQHTIDSLETQAEKHVAQIQLLELRVQTQSRAIETRHWDIQVRACVRACVRARVCACVSACV